TVATLAIGYGIVVYIILISGALFSPHVIMLYLLMLTGFWTDRKIIGHPTVLVNLVAFYIIYVYTAEEPLKFSMFDYCVSTKIFFTIQLFTHTLLCQLFIVCQTIFPICSKRGKRGQSIAYKQLNRSCK